MQEILYNYEPPSPTTWVYLSSLITIAVYFKFRRFWSVRNLDLVGLILLAPGLLMLFSGLSGNGRRGEREIGRVAERQGMGAELPIGKELGEQALSPSPTLPLSPSSISPAAVERRQKAELGREKGANNAELGRQLARRGYLWLFVVGGFFLVRMLADSAMVRRPLLEPNLSASGLTFTCAAMLLFLMSNVVNPPRPAADANPPHSLQKWEGAAKAGEQKEGESGRKAESPIGKEQGEKTVALPPLLPFSPSSDQAVKVETSASGEKSEKAVNGEKGESVNRENGEILEQRGPGYPLFHVFSAESDSPAKRATAIIAHLAVVLGMVLIGYRHFDNTHTGIAAATLYLLLPYTANFTPRIDHVVPAALLVLAIQSYRRPVVAGIFVGLAAGLTWYPLFLLPLWCSFYWRRGLLRFSLAVIVVLMFIAASLAITPAGLGSFMDQFRQTFGLKIVRDQNIRGFWEGMAPFRWPVLTAFVAMCLSMVFWPAQKNLGSLLACSAAVMLGTQFWKAYEGGTFMAWYLPLLILTIFRPNLEDRVALSAVSEGWVKWRK